MGGAMNLLVDSAAGAIALTPDEARQRIAQLREQLANARAAAVTPLTDVRGIEREIRRLVPIAEPERAYDMDYYEGPV